MPVPADRSSPALGGSRVVHWIGKGRGVFRMLRFALATGIGFMIAEIILVLGVIVLYHTTDVPDISAPSTTILMLDALALGIGVTAAFEINERVTVRGRGEERRRGRKSWLLRLGKYQLASLLGNSIVVGVQLALLAWFSLSPELGSIVGAVVSYPVTYVASMVFVWKVHPFREEPGASGQADK